MAEGFRERAERVNELLADSRSAFVLVTSPRARRDRGGGLLPPPPAATRACRSRGVVANRVHAGGAEGDPAAELERAARRRALARQGRCAPTRSSAAWPRATAATSTGLRRRLGRKPMIEVPQLDDDVHDLDGLRRMDEYLFG